MTLEETPQGQGPTPPPPPGDVPPPPSQPAPSPAAGGASDNRNIMVVLSYLWLLALIPLLVEKDDAEVQWHAKHGLVLLVAEVAFWVALTIITSVLGAITGGILGCVFALLTPLFALAFLVVHILCIVKGVKGERFTIPAISEFADKF